jgi:hypothetical protein
VEAALRKRRPSCRATGISTRVLRQISPRAARARGRRGLAHQSIGRRGDRRDARAPVGGRVIRGSSTHTGARALRDYYVALVQENISPVITPDGPRGPRFKFKPGAILLAQMSGRPMLPLAYAASRASLIKWDKFVHSGGPSRALLLRSARRVMCRASLMPRTIERCSSTWKLNSSASMRLQDPLEELTDRAFGLCPSPSLRSSMRTALSLFSSTGVRESILTTKNGCG